MSDLETRIAEVLAAHVSNGDSEWCALETCFYEFGAEGFHEGMTFEEGFAHHLTDMLAPVIAEAQAEALREAVIDFEAHVGVGEFAEQSQRGPLRWGHIEEAWEHQGPYMDWLRTRADKLVTA